jgi:DEAD/DEAH box helicase domain-containing protein
MITDLNDFFSWWENSEQISPNITSIRDIDPSEGGFSPFPTDLPSEMIKVLLKQGITSLYSHQADSYRLITQGENVVVTTGTSSGKTLCYNLPVIKRMMCEKSSTAIYIFPTKALAHDQQKNLQDLISELNQNDPVTSPNFTSAKVAVYDGDTSSSSRISVRKQARILITNPDMIHIGILPHHTLWKEFFAGLDYIVVDEIHLYRGVFGSHVANIIRRLRRIAHFYGKDPQFILTSATISNASQHAERLIECSVKSIDHDGSPHGRKHFLLYNPPVINLDLGIRRSVIFECTALGLDLYQNDIQTIIFSRSRREVEVILRNLLESVPKSGNRIRGYRAGYLAKDRREIEDGLRSGIIRLTVSTNALELGIDIGGMDAIILVGYPGSIASVRQQAGRAGRRKGSSLALFLATGSPLDQYLVNHPDYLFERSPEQALIDPDNTLILLEHIKCSAFELAFRIGEPYGDLTAEKTLEFLEFLKEEGVLYSGGDRYFWMADKYPASQISLRNASPSQITLRTSNKEQFTTIGIIDYSSALWMVHKDAIYLHEGQQFRVESLNLEAGEAILKLGDFDYYTVPQLETNISLINTHNSTQTAVGQKSYGDLLVSQKVTGYKKIRWDTQENLGVEPILDLPIMELQTTGYWFQLGSDSVDTLRNMGFWSSDTNQYGKDWEKIRDSVRRRDSYTCQSCGKVESSQEFHVHHRIPFRQFQEREAANRLDNLVTLCPICHMKAEAVIRIRSGLSGCRYVLANLAPLFLMCDVRDLGSTVDPQCKFCDGQPAVIFYDQVPGGIGLSKSLFENHIQILNSARDLVNDCSCKDGCPACVGAAGSLAEGGKLETLALLDCLVGKKL